MIKNHSTVHHFDSEKWKKRLINFSHKLHRSYNNNHHWNASSTTTSATAMAAAKEKFIRHSSPPSSEIVIHSEDLTASQFANLTGIKTKRNSIYSTSVPTSDGYLEEDSDSDEEDDEEYSRDYYYSSTTSASSSYQPTVRIWDSHFWQDHRKSLPTNISTLTSTTSIQDISTKAEPIKPILTSQPLCRHTSEPGGTKVPSMIQKGRFKIVWGNDDNEPISAPESHCVEWKRKRAGSNSSALTTSI